MQHDVLPVQYYRFSVASSCCDHRLVAFGRQANLENNLDSDVI